MSPERYESIGGVAALAQSVWTGLPLHLLSQPGPTGWSASSTAEQVVKGWSGAGKVAIITGANSGLGLESSRVLAMHGCDVVMAGRDMTALRREAERIRARHPGALVTPMHLDLASMESIAGFATDFLATGKPLNILLLNAGVMACPFALTREGHEMQFGVNHLGHFLLTQLLVAHMDKTAKQQGVDGRIVVLSSLAHATLGYLDIGIRFDTLSSKKDYSPFKAYGQSKLCNVLFARELNRRLRLNGMHVVAVSLHPGAIVTNIPRHLVPPWLQAWMGWLLQLFFKTIPQGAATQVYCCTAPSILPGEYYSDVNVAGSHRWAHDRRLGEKLWALSQDMCAAYLPKQGSLG